ncbi:MAG: 5'/3'-nucleotidase SurE [Planctomycetota bacterium]|nr:MAG: 5'/3'-nucleotidase SurE [Planctomycetota bacterium]
MDILVTNDDGVDAPGLQCLARQASHFGRVTVVAPREVFSGCGHMVTTRRPLQVVRRTDSVFVVDGSPADCVRLAKTELLEAIDLVLAGVNDGANLGIDIHMSGTVAAVREAALYGIPGIAFSQYRRGPQQQDWSVSAAAAQHLLSDLLNRPLEAGEFWNVNFPAWNGQPERFHWKLCRPDEHPLPVRYERDGGRFVYAGDYHARPYAPGTDVDVCFGGLIAVSRLRAMCRP